MKIDNKLLVKLNEQVNHELHAAYLYLSMSAYFETKSLAGFANWMRMQFNEEIGHAMKIFDFINERGETVTLTKIEGPKTKWRSPLEAFEDSLAHEQKVTALINALMDLAIKVNDHATVSFLKWYVDEQVEEESQVAIIIDKLKMIGDSNAALLMLDKQLGERK